MPLGLQLGTRDFDGLTTLRPNKFFTFHQSHVIVSVRCISGLVGEVETRSCFYIVSTFFFFFLLIL